MFQGVSQETLKAALIAAENAPDPRSDRVSLAIAHLDAGETDAHLVAQAMIASILAESTK